MRFVRSACEVVGFILFATGMITALMAGYLFVSGLFGARSVNIATRGSSSPNYASTDGGTALFFLAAAAILVLLGLGLRWVGGRLGRQA